jgi:hypothetical protein
MRNSVSRSEIAAGATLSSKGHRVGVTKRQWIRSFECQYPPDTVTKRKYSPLWLTTTGSAPER